MSKLQHFKQGNLTIKLMWSILTYLSLIYQSAQTHVKINVWFSPTMLKWGPVEEEGHKIIQNWKRWQENLCTHENVRPTCISSCRAATQLFIVFLWGFVHVYQPGRMHKQIVALRTFLEWEFVLTQQYRTNGKSRGEIRSSLHIEHCWEQLWASRWHP